MPITLVLIVLAGHLGAGIFIANQRKRYRIRSSGTRVMAKVIQVRSWQNSTVQGTPLLLSMVPFIAGGWQYEVIVEGTDPRSGESYIIASGRKNGLPEYQRGDYLPTYISPRGNYVEL
ncbi:MAG: hypothetical protein M3Z24_02400 [Chloroflexota bacterium]|nr:hypothetical protein [Chloroflexota bacterium]